MTTSDPFREYSWGMDAAKTFGVATPESVWRQIARHADDYPGEIEVVEVGRRKMVKREELVAFTRWFAAGPGRLDKRIKVSVGADEVEAGPAATAGGDGRGERRAGERPRGGE